MGARALSAPSSTPACRLGWAREGPACSRPRPPPSKPAPPQLRREGGYALKQLPLADVTLLAGAPLPAGARVTVFAMPPESVRSPSPNVRRCCCCTRCAVCAALRALAPPLDPRCYHATRCDGAQAPICSSYVDVFLGGALELQARFGLAGEAYRGASPGGAYSSFVEETIRTTHAWSRRARTGCMSLPRHLRCAVLRCSALYSLRCNPLQSSPCAPRWH